MTLYLHSVSARSQRLSPGHRDDNAIEASAFNGIPHRASRRSINSRSVVLRNLFAEHEYLRVVLQLFRERFIQGIPHGIFFRTAGCRVSPPLSVPL